MKPRASEDFPNLTGPHEREDAAEKLRQESSQLLGVHSRKDNSTTGDGFSGANTSGKNTSLQGSRIERAAAEKSTLMRGLKGDYYTVSSGDNLTAIAQRMLKLRGEKVSSRDVYDEVNRIVELNIEKYPWLEKNPNKIRAGMIIQVWDKETGPDPTCRWKDWKDADPGRINVALRCESIFAGKGAQVVVTPGSRAVFTESSYGFIAPKGYARALPGAHVMAVGGEVIDDGGALQILHPEVKVRADRRSTTPEQAVLATNGIAPAGEVKISPSYRGASTEETIEVPPI